MSDPLGLLQPNNQPKPRDPLGLLPAESDPLGLLDKPTSTQPKPAKPFLSKVKDALSAIGQNTIDLEEAEQRGQRAVGETGLALVGGMGGAVIGPTAMVVERLKTPGGGYPKIFDKEAAARAKRVKEGTQELFTYKPKNEGAKALLESIEPILSAPAVLGNLLERDPKKAESYGQGLPAGLDKAGRVVGGTLREAGEPIRHALSSYGLGEGVVEDLAKTGLEFYGYGKAAQGMKAVPKKLTSIKDFGKRKWAELTVKERGLVVQSLDDLLAKGYSEAEILRNWGNPDLFAEALKRRATPEQSAKPVDLTRRRDLKPDDMEALPPASYEGQGQGFVMSDPKQASILRKAEREPDYTVGTIPEDLIVEYKPILSSNGSPYKTESAAEKAAIKKGLTNNFEIIPVDGGYGYRKLGTEQQVSPQQELPQTTYKAELDANLRKGFDIKSDRDTLDFVLDAMKSDLLAGEKGGFKGYDEAGDAVYLGSGHAKWYRDLTKEYANAEKSNTGKSESFSAAQLVNIIDKGIKGDKLTERQLAIWERLNRIADTEARRTYAPLVENYEKGLEYDNINKSLEVAQVDPGRIAESKLDLVADLERKAIQEGVDSEAAAAEVESFFQSIADAHHVGKERRKNFAHRKRISEMSVDELRTALQTDHLTGQANKRAYDEGTRQPYQVSIDVDGLKYVNDKFGHSAGNDLLVAVGDALSQAAKDVKNYHIHGDEFVLEGADPVQLTNILQEARRTLKNKPLKFGEETYAPDFSYGIAETLEQADKLMQAHKAQRRVVRGEKIPPADLPSVETVTKPSEKAVSAKEETATLEGMSEADTFTLTNPETEFSDYLPIQAAANQPMLPAVFDAQKTVSTIKSLKDSPQDAVPYLTDLGKNVIQEGNASFISWSKGMKEYLGDAWESFKPVINEVWKVLQDTIKNERGSITIPNPNDIKSTLNNIWNTTVKSRKIVDQLPDAKIRHRYILTPHWYAEEYPAFRKYFNRERQRVDERTAAVHEYLQEWASARELNSAKQKELASLIWDMEYRKIDSVTEPLYRWSKTADGKPLVEAISLKHIRQVGEHLSKQGKWSPEVISAFLDIQKYFAKTRAEILNILSKSKEVEPQTIEYYRQQVGAIPFYFPHNRYGNYRVKGVDKAGNTIYRQHYYDVPVRGYSVRGKSILDEAKQQFPGEDIQWSVSKVKQMPEEFFEYPIPVEAMGRILQEAAARAKDISPEAADLFAKVLPQATADIIKSRGFGQRMITRENIPGFEKENILQVLYDHSQGLAGWKSKMSAARDMSKMLMEGKRTDTPNVTSYAMRYIRDVMSNADRIDRVVDNIRAYYYWNFLWGNLKSGAVNLTQLAATGVPVLSYHSNSIQAARLFPASVNALTNMIKTGKGLTPEEAKFLLDEFNTGRLQDQYIQEVKGKISGPFAQTVQKAMDVGGWPMSVTERFIRSVFTLTAYRIARSGKITNPQTLERYGLEKGKPATDAQAREFALDANDEANVVFGKSNLPELLRGRGKILRPAYSLMSFYTGFILLLRKFLSAKSGWRGKKSFIQSMIGLISLGGVVSAPFYKLLMRYFREEHGDDYEKALREKIPDAPFENKDLFRDSIMYGMPAALGVDIGGSLDMGPFSYSDGDNVAEKIMKSIIGVPYSTVESVERAGKALSSGEYLRAVEAIAPKAVANPLVARRLYTEGQRTTSGKPVNLPGEVDARKITLWEAIAKSFGFQPVSATKSYQVYTAMQELQEFVAQKRRSFADRYANASARDDQGEMDRVMDEVSAWNEKWFEAGKPEYVINLRDSIRTRTQTAQPPKRFRALGEEYKNLYGDQR